MPTTTSALRAPLTALGITLAVLAAFGPPLLQPQSYHDFADQRALYPSSSWACSDSPACPE